jgi:hypothetical protein
MSLAGQSEETIMRADFTRVTFDLAKHYSGVLQQQGRVQLDADWNEQSAILLHYLRTLATDLIGEHAGPLASLGFEIITKGSAARLDELLPDSERRRELHAALEVGDAVIAPGRYYVRGVLVEAEQPMLYTEQPGYPFDESTSVEALKDFDRGMLVYLDVWERLVTSLEDDEIREAALGGPDTCARSQVVFRVRVLLEPSESEPAFDCSAVKTLPEIGGGLLRARARRDKPPTELCTIPPESRYRGAENQLYRVEIHRGGAAGDGESGATFKWSRDNGSVVFAIRSAAGNRVELETLGRDECSGLSPGDWVEVVDDSVVFGLSAGLLAQVESIDRDAIAVTLSVAAGSEDLPSYSADEARQKHALLRRWDHTGDASLGGALRVVEQVTNTERFIDLEDGVQIAFADAGPYRAGDYWLVPARVATGDVEWPKETSADGQPVLDSDGNPIGAARPPDGPRHCYAPLLLVPARTQDAGAPTDCRRTLEPLGFRNTP